MEAIGNDQDFTDVGHECHIVARQDDPQVARSPSSLTDEERDEFKELIEDRHAFSNLVLMCLKHSRVIDDPKQCYSVARVVEIKRDHEAKMKKRRTPEDRREAASEMAYAGIVDEWEERVGPDDWERLMSPLIGDGHPRMTVEHFDSLRSAADWLFKRVWPRTIPDLEAGFENFRRVLQDLLNVLERYPHVHLRDTQGLVAIARFYNDPAYWGPGEPDHRALRAMYEYWSAPVEDLAYELTRAANLVCDVVRRTLDPSFRAKHGVTTLTGGPFMDFSVRTYRPHYAPDAGCSPYEGLPEFVNARSKRDFHRGEGRPPSGLDLPVHPGFTPSHQRRRRVNCAGWNGLAIPGRAGRVLSIAGVSVAAPQQMKAVVIIESNLKARDSGTAWASPWRVGRPAEPFDPVACKPESRCWRASTGERSSSRGRALCTGRIVLEKRSFHGSTRSLWIGPAPLVRVAS